MREDGVRRRSVLMYGGLAAGSFIGIAGCQGQGDDDGGSQDNAGGSQGKKVRKIVFTSLSSDTDPVRLEIAKLIVEQWRKLGIEVEINPVSFPKMVELTINTREWDIVNVGWAGSPDNIDPDQFTYRVFHSSQAKPGAFNIYGYENPEYDKLAEEQRRTMNREKRQEIVYKCQEIIARDQPLTPIANQDIIHPYLNTRFRNMIPSLGFGLMGAWNFLDSEPKSGVSTMRVGHTEEHNKLNPMDTTAIHDYQLVQLVYDQLVRLGPQGEIRPWLAKEVNVVDDTTVRLPLRTDVTFHDGEPLTPEDVKFSYEYTHEHSPANKTLIDPIESVSIHGDSEVECKLKHPFAPFLANTLGQILIIPKHVWKDIPESVDAELATNWANPDVIGSGPFKFDYWRRSEQLHLVANKDHFHPPNVDELIEVVFSDMNSAVRALRQKEIDMIGVVPPPATINRLADLEFVTNEILSDHGFLNTGYKVTREPFDDRAFRRALAYATPKERIVQIVLDGKGTVTHSVIAEINEFWHSPDVEKFTFDLEAARMELKEAGYTWDGDGKLHHPA